MNLEQRKLAKRFVAPNGLQHVSVRVRSLTGICAGHGKSGLAKKAFDYIKAASGKAAEPEQELAEIIGATDRIKALGDLPEDRDEAYDKIADWVNEEIVHIDKFQQIVCKYWDSPAVAAAKSLARDASAKILGSHFLHDVISREDT